MKRIRSCAIIIDKRNILLLWRKIGDDAYFVFPGGGLESGETLAAAAEREAKEETSLAVKAEKLIYRVVDENSEHNFFLCSHISGEPQLGSEEISKMSESNQYRLEWKKIGDLSGGTVFPLEVRDWIIEDFKNSFSGPLREMIGLWADRRKE